MSAKAPSEEEIEEKFIELVESGLDFFVRASQELESEQKFSILHFSTGLELILKARLYAEHWSLIASSPHSCQWSALITGETHTLGAKKVCPTITSIIGTDLGDEQKVFEDIFDHRNQVVHWIQSDDIAVTAAEQCRAWYHLVHLLTREWRETFKDFLPEITSLENEHLEYRTYLQTRFEALKNELKGLNNAGRLITCPACKFDAGILETQANHFSEFECPVCTTVDYIIHFSCGNWLPIQDAPVECPCGGEHELVDFLLQEHLSSELRQNVLDIAVTEPYLSPKERSIYEGPEAHCGECLSYEKTVRPTGSDFTGDPYICVECATEFALDDIGWCGSCEVRWAGFDLEGTRVTGCELCDGPIEY